MRNLILVCLAATVIPAMAQMVAPKKPVPVERSTAPCADCGVVRQVRTITKELQPSANTETKPSGLVASVPLGGGKPQVGSSVRYGSDAVTTTEKWEITIRMDDQRFRIITVDEKPNLREGDKVRVSDRNEVTLRTD